MGLSAEELLENPNYFRCEQHQTIMRKAACSNMQARAEAGKKNGYRSGDEQLRLEKCLNCGQGRKINEQLRGGEKVEEKKGLAPVKEAQKEKVCSKCGQSKTLEEFSFLKKSDGRRKASCKACDAEYSREYLQRKKLEKEQTDPKRVQEDQKVPADDRTAYISDTAEKETLGLVMIDLVRRADGTVGVRTTDALESAYHSALDQALTLRRVIQERV